MKKTTEILNIFVTICSITLFVSCGTNGDDDGTGARPEPDKSATLTWISRQLILMLRPLRIYPGSRFFMVHPQATTPKLSMLAM